MRIHPFTPIVIFLFTVGPLGFSPELGAQDPATGRLALEITKMRNANLASLQTYHWKTKTEVAFEGVTVVTLEKVRFDPDGNLVKEVTTSGHAAPNPEQGRKAQAYSDRFRAVIARYTEPSTETFMKFFSNARFSAGGTGALEGTILVRGGDLLVTGDQLSLWLESDSLHPIRLEFSSRIEEDPIEADVQFTRLPGGPYHVSSTKVRLGGQRVAGVVTNYDYVSPEAARLEAEDSPLEEQDWPRSIEKGGDVLTLYQPQAEAWENRLKIEATAAFSLEQKGAKEPTYGVISFDARTTLDQENRLVLVSRIKPTEVILPDLDEKARLEAEKRVRQIFPRGPIPYELERFVAGVEEDLDDSSGFEITFDPPEIIVSQVEAVLVPIEGDPLYEPIEGTPLEHVLNTEWDLFRHRETGEHFLLVEGRLLGAPDLSGPWTDRSASSLGTLPDEPRWQDARKSLSETSAASGEAPFVYVRTQLAELVVVEGQPDFVPIAGTQLFDVRNTDDDLFFHTSESQYYFLVSGRWFRSASLDGPWGYAGDVLPDDFALIPPEHPRGHVLASVRGTPEAQESVLMAQIPRTATVERHSPEVVVEYFGEPGFSEIEGIGVFWCENTTDDVFRVGDTYYLCREGVWFSAPGHDGPWRPCVEIPDEIYDIPSDHPAYHVTFVRVYDYDDEEVTYGYTAPYVGYYWADGLVFWGYGWRRWWPRSVRYYRACHYRPYWRHHRNARYWRHRAHRFPHVQPYGRGAYYDPTRGRYGYTRYPGVRRSKTARVSGAMRGYESWGTGRGVMASRTRPRTVSSSPVPGVRRRGNIYAGKDGRVYRKQNGKWQTREGKRWQDVSRGRPSARDRSGTSAREKPGTKARPKSKRVPRDLNRQEKVRRSGSARVTKRRSIQSRPTHRGGYRGGYRGGAGRGRR